MKHISSKLIILILILLALFSLNGCGSKPITESGYVKGQDFQYMYFRQGSSPIMAEAENGYYFFSGYYLYYADKQTMKPVILCNKPNCQHDMEKDSQKVYNCNAFFKNGALPFIAYYDRDIYVTSQVLSSTSGETEFLKVSSDGTKRKTIFKFDISPSFLAIHRGKLYYAQNAFNKNQKSVSCIKEFDLKKPGSKPRELYKGSNEGGHIQDLMCYGNNLYFWEIINSERLLASISMRCDISTGKASKLFPNVHDMDMEQASYPAIHNGKIYYSVAKYGADGKAKTKKSYVCDLDGRNSREIFNIDKDSVYLADQKYLYTNDVIWSADAKPKDQQKLRIRDDSGKVIDSIKTGYINNSCSIICGGDSHVFITTSTDKKYQIFYGDKKQFGTGKIQLKPFFEIDRERMTPGISVKTDADILN